MKTSFRFLFVALGFLVLMGCSWFLPGPEPGPGLYPDIAVYVNVGAREILSGSTYDFGNVPVGESVIARFTVANVGDKVLHMETGVPRTLNPLGVFVVTSLLVNSLPSQEEAPFSIIFTPVEYGPVSIMVSIPSDDPDESDYTLTVKGNGSHEPVPTPNSWALPSAYRIVSLDTDPEGNVYVHGAYLASDLFYFTTKFDASGAILWSRVEEEVEVSNWGNSTIKRAPMLHHNGYLYEIVEDGWETYPVIQKISASDGELVWSAPGGDSSGFVEDADGLYHGGIRKIDYDGNEIYELDTGFYEVQRKVGNGAYLYMSGWYGSSEEYLVARHSYDLDAGDWMLLWPIGSTELRPVGYPLPLAVAQGTPFGDILYVAGKRSDTDEPAIFAYGDLGTVEDGWCVTVGTNASEVPMSAVADAQGAVYLVSRDGMTIYVTNVQPVSATSGEIAWRTSYDVSYPDTHIATEPGLGLSPDGDILYVVDGTNMVKRFNPADGDEFN